MNRYSRKKPRTNQFERLLKIVNILVLIGLLLGCLSVYISPISFVIPAFFGISFMIWFIVNTVLLLIWIYIRRLFFLIPLIGFVAGIQNFTHIVQFNSNSNPEGIKVLSYNVRLFDINNWYSNPIKENHKKIIDFVGEEKPDIVCFQEFFTDDSGEFPVLDLLLSKKGIPKYYHIDYFQTRRKTYHWGIATFSNYPIINRERYQFRNSIGNYCVYTDVIKSSDTIRIFNVHMESWHFKEEDYDFITDVKNDLDINSKSMHRLKNIYWKMSSSYQKRSVQTLELVDLIKESPYSVIVCGDFNDTPVSYSYSKINNVLTDSFLEAGNGFGSSYSGVLPIFRIDYIFHSNEFDAINYKTYKKDYSDHHPISVYLKRKSK
ncbi:MAG: endonuclease/exonuclease/phosphatase family protein [Bacteroidota bacterium]|nr:endonuclease/exonuclease/phosphatase family protein [Bacteroidota bacterium]